ncbi:hypothetical protein ACFSC4_16730 [Deinococcus malanensis]|uniref:hypothetical protein n=1 Tax=Deinococcus malanensis TaxID=1706855 RepID=UPI00362B85CF
MPFRLRSRRSSSGHCSLGALGAALLLGALSGAQALNVRVLVSSGQQVTVRVPVTPTPPRRWRLLPCWPPCPSPRP